MTVLLIDDDPEDTALFAEALYELYPAATCLISHSCEDIQSTVNRIDEIDMIFLDGHVYPVGGKTCLTQLIKMIDHSKTQIVIYSGSLSPAEKLELETIGADHILIKPPNYKLLKSSIGEILARHFDPDPLSASIPA